MGLRKRPSVCVCVSNNSYQQSPLSPICHPLPLPFQQTIQELESDLSKLQEYIDCIGTPLDSRTNRAEIKRLRSVIKNKVTSTKAELKSGRKSQTPQQKILADRQASQLEGQISKFQRLLDKEKTAVKQHPQPGWYVRR